MVRNDRQGVSRWHLIRANTLARIKNERRCGKRAQKLLIIGPTTKPMMTKLLKSKLRKKWLLLASGIVGSLTYAFSDSFWFSAVEAEVYAMSSFSTAVVVWCILKWDAIEDEAKANRFLILIAYVVGLSIGVHLLNLLALPALALVYYFKKFKASTWGILLALFIGGLAVLFVNDLVVLGLPTLAGYFELFFVNSLENNSPDLRTLHAGRPPSRGRAPFALVPECGDKGKREVWVVGG